jgi:hypothetical protein
MDVESERASLAELFRILSNREISDEDEADLVADAMSALANPKAYADAVVEEDPEESWLAEYYISGEPEDLAKDGRKLLSWIVYHQLMDWVCRSDKLDELLEQIDDCVADAGFEMEPLTYDYEDEPENPHEHYFKLAKERLAEVSGQTKTLIHLDTGMSDEIDVYLVNSADRPRLFELAQHYDLRAKDSWV